MANPLEAYNKSLPVNEWPQEQLPEIATGLSETVNFYQLNPETPFPQITSDFYKNCCKINTAAKSVLKEAFNPQKFGFNPHFDSIVALLSNPKTNELTLKAIDKAFGFKVRLIDTQFVGAQLLKQLEADA